MDKYEYRVKTEQMVKLVNKKDYKTAMQIADTIDWRRVKSVAMLCTVSEIYEKNKRFEESREVLLIAYDRAPIGRMIVYRLAELALKMNDMDEAIDCYEEFVHIAPRDSGRYILEYKILRKKKAPLEKQIAVLEQLKKVDYHERWAYELARLYEEAGQLEQCIELCDELALWFSDGEYVIRALELKSRYEPLTAIQQETYRHRHEIPEAPETAFEEPAQEGYTQSEGHGEREVPMNAFQRSVHNSSVFGGSAPYPADSQRAAYADSQRAAYSEDSQVYAPRTPVPQETIPLTDISREDYGAPEEAWAPGMDVQPAWAEAAGTADTEEESTPEFRLPDQDEKIRTIYIPEEVLHPEKKRREPQETRRRERDNSEPRRRESQEPRRSGLLDKFFNKEKEKEEKNREYPDFDSIQVEALQDQAFQKPSHQEDVFQKEPEFTVPQVQVGKFDTMNLQAELAKSMAELLNSDVAGPQVPQQVPTPEEEEEKKAKLLHAQTKKITDEDTQGKLLGNTKEFVLLPKNQPPLTRQQPRKVKDFREVLSEDNDGQISLFIEEQKVPEKQITGQMNLDEILEEWNKTKQAAQEAIAEAARKKDASHTDRDIVQEEESKIPAEIRDLLSELEAESQDSLWSLRGRKTLEETAWSEPEAPEEEISEDEAEENEENLEEAVQPAEEPAAEEPAAEEPAAEEELAETFRYEEEPVAEEETAEADQYETEPMLEEAAEDTAAEPARYEAEAVPENEEPNKEAVPEVDDNRSDADGPKLRVHVEAAIPPEIAVERSLNAAAAALEKAVKLGAALTGKKQEDEEEPVGPEEPLAVSEPENIIEETEQIAEAEPPAEEFAEPPAEELAEPPAEELADAPAEETNPYASLDSMMGIWPPRERVEPQADKPLEEKTEEELYAEMIGGRGQAAYEMVKEIIPEAAHIIPKPELTPEEELYIPDSEPPQEEDFADSALNLAQEVAAMMGGDSAEDTAEELLEEDAVKEVQEPAAGEIMPEAEEEFGAEGIMPEAEEEPAVEEFMPEEQQPGAEWSYEEPVREPVSRERRRELQRDKLTDGQKKLFSYFMSVRGMEEYIAKVIYDDLYNETRNGTSCSGNILVIGRPGAGKTSLAINVVKAIQKERNLATGKLAKVTGEALNKKNVSDIVNKIYGGALLIEQAGKMNIQTAENLSRVLNGDTGELLVLIEDERKSLMKLLETCPALAEQFTSKLEVPVFMNDELVAFGETYAREFGYKIDDMGVLALYSRIDELQREDHAVTVGEVKEIVDEAMSRAEKGGVKKIMKSIFKKRKTEGSRKLLLEQDFGIK